MADVFLSYTGEDRALAERVVHGLRASGFTVWWDPDIRNQRWDQTIEREISAARSVVVLWTPASTESQWVREEANYAKDHGNKLIQAKCGPTTPPLGFTLVQCADLSNFSTNNGHTGWDKLVSWVSEMVGGAPEVRRTLERFRQHFMEVTGDGLEAYNSIDLHTPVDQMLEDFSNADEFCELACSWCVESGAYTVPSDSEDDWLSEELGELYDSGAPSITVGHLVELVRERTAQEAAKSKAAASRALERMLDKRKKQRPGSE